MTLRRRPGNCQSFLKWVDQAESKNQGVAYEGKLYHRVQRERFWRSDIACIRFSAAVASTLIKANSVQPFWRFFLRIVTFGGSSAEPALKASLYFI